VGVTWTTRKLNSQLDIVLDSLKKKQANQSRFKEIGGRERERNVRDSVGLGSDSERVQLGGVEPGEREPARAEEDDVEEETEGSSLGRVDGVAEDEKKIEDQLESKSTEARGGDEGKAYGIRQAKVMIMETI
jgi:hypothetical protein